MRVVLLSNKNENNCLYIWIASNVAKKSIPVNILLASSAILGHRFSIKLKFEGFIQLI